MKLVGIKFYIKRGDIYNRDIYRKLSFGDQFEVIAESDRVLYTRKVGLTGSDEVEVIPRSCFIFDFGLREER